MTIPEPEIPERDEPLLRIITVQAYVASPADLAKAAEILARVMAVLSVEDIECAMRIADVETEIGERVDSLEFEEETDDE